jgi:hypothetical protein
MTITRFRDLAIVMIAVLGLTTSLLVLRLRNSTRCTIGDVSASVPEGEKLVKSEEFGWIRQARFCDLGTFVVVTSPRDSRAVMVLSKQNPTRALFAASAGSSALFDPDGKRGLRGMVAEHTTNSTSSATMVFDTDGTGSNLFVTPDTLSLVDVNNHRVLLELTHSTSGQRRLSYTGFDPARNAWIENIDAGVDGTLDLRMTETPGHPKTIEVRVGERWLERVDRDGQVGTIVDGRWMTFTDARAKFEPHAVEKSK